MNIQQHQHLAQLICLGEATPASQTAATLLVARAATVPDEDLEQFCVEVAGQITACSAGKKFNMVALQRALAAIVTASGHWPHPNLATELIANAQSTRLISVDADGAVFVPPNQNIQPAKMPDDGLITLREFARSQGHRGEAAVRFVDRLKKCARRYCGGLKPKVPGRAAVRGQKAGAARYDPAYLVDIAGKMTPRAGTTRVPSGDSGTNR